jgi:predicted transcriptional regulator
MTETRVTIAEAVRDHPGIHFNELVRSLDLASGQVQYHLERLRKEGSVVVERVYGRTHFYPPAYDEWERRALALLRRETAGDVVASLLANGPTRPGRVADELGIARSTLEWHLDRLVDHGLVEKRRRGGRVTLAVDESERAVELLREADPTLRDRLVDRFTRLVDRLFEG